ncbi:hypothetical protein [Sulfurihydrogenibium azorense]|jgi:hypothetical protein|uniref:Uncharacterized protein n=1 Tax=Sulfurihydrogenibium azorense (strain DSM 15241 / OCM 825 / Az-Fu1) TaxID=204536 RepID=C1DVL7_SULAA|nr:hypothetical protein [Sulfurihydrogenibium azorense]ACN98912.1 conserved hypothetical protein [Sulfurihydrogenibium azorense Az-Fu1]MDM7274342.1 hypothetical protein [Sulfurihydrogenibium azorense]
MYCYIDYVENENNELRFGVLVVDKKLKPVEFRITSKIILEDIQKILYGETLKETLFIEKIGNEILNSVESNYDYIFCKDKSFLLLRNSTSKPIFLLEKFDEFKPRDRYSVKLVSPLGKFDNISLKYLSNDEKYISSITKELLEIFKYADIMEPFKRIEKAINYIDKSGLYD